MDQGWDQWSADYDRPLGAPLAPATHNPHTAIWHRRFASGTEVWLDGGKNDWKGGWGVPCIRWADNHTTGKAGCDRHYAALASRSR